MKNILPSHPHQRLETQPNLLIQDFLLNQNQIGRFRSTFPKQGLDSINTLIEESHVRHLRSDEQFTPPRRYEGLKEPLAQSTSTSVSEDDVEPTINDILTKIPCLPLAILVCVAAKIDTDNDAKLRTIKGASEWVHTQFNAPNSDGEKIGLDILERFHKADAVAVSQSHQETSEYQEEQRNSYSFS